MAKSTNENFSKDDQTELFERRSAEEIFKRVNNRYAILGGVIIAALSVLGGFIINYSTEKMKEFVREELTQEIDELKLTKREADDHLLEVHNRLQEVKTLIRKSSDLIVKAKGLDTLVGQINKIHHDLLEVQMTTEVARKGQLDLIREAALQSGSSSDERITHTTFHAIIAQYPILISPDIQNIPTIIAQLEDLHFSVDTLEYRYKDTKPIGIRIQSDMPVEIAQKIIKIIHENDKRLEYVYLGDINIASVDNTFIGTRGETDDEDKIPLKKINFEKLLKEGLSQQEFIAMIKETVKG